MKKILMIFVLMSALFSQGNDRYGTYISTWFDALMMATDTTFNGVTGGQYMQDGRGNLSIFSVDGKNNRVGFGKLNPAYTVDVSGTLFATTILGDGSGLSGIASGTGGIINTGSTTIGADSNVSGVGEVVIQTRGLTRMTINNAGGIVLASSVDIALDSGSLTINGTGIFTGNLKANSNFVMEGYPTGRNVLRSIQVQITGLTDNTQLTVSTADVWNGEVLNSETIDTDTPTSGTRFDISGDGMQLLIKGLSQTIIGVPIGAISYNNTGVEVYDVSVEELSGNIQIQLRNTITALKINMADPSKIPNNKLILIQIFYITST